MSLDELEARLRDLCGSGDHAAAAELALTTYGPEIMRFLVAMLHTHDDSSEAFSIFAGALWQGLPRFRWQASFRTWSYTLARRAYVAVVRSRSRRRREVPLSPELGNLVHRVRTETLEYLRTESRDRLVRLRDELSPDDQTLLILRVDRNLTWPEIARVMADDDDPADGALERLVPALRKRFERIKNRLRRLHDSE